MLLFWIALFSSRDFTGGERFYFTNLELLARSEMKTDNDKLEEKQIN